MITNTERMHVFPAFTALVPGLRVIADDEGFPIVAGARGRIEWYDDAQLAVYTSRPRLFGALQMIPGVRKRQLGDHEARFLFEPAALAKVARVIQARRKRVSVAPPSAAQLEARACFAATHGRPAVPNK